MTYEWVKALHVACAVATAMLLLLRLLLAARGTDYRQCGALRWLPHAIDTLLLLAAGLLVWWSAQYPFLQPWLTAKVLALPVYVIAAAIALDPARKTRTRITGGIVAILVLAYILAVAVTRQVIPFSI